MDDYSFYPDKPSIETKKAKNSLGLTVFSMALFVLGLLLIFPNFFSFIIILLCVLLIHELGHFMFMKIFAYKNVRMLFVPLMGAFVSGTKEKYSQKESFIIVLAGPIPGIIIGFISFYFAQNSHSDWLMTASLLFLFLNILNLIPLDPLDGGQLLRLMITRKKDFFQFLFSLISSLLMIAFGIYLQNYILIGFGFLMSFRVRSNQKNFQIRKELKEDDVQYETTYEDLNNKQYAQIKQIVLRHTPALEKYISLNSGEDAEPIVAVQVKNVLSPPMTYDVSFFTKTVAVLLWLSAIIVPVLYLLNNNIDWYGKSVGGW